MLLVFIMLSITWTSYQTLLKHFFHLIFIPCIWFEEVLKITHAFFYSHLLYACYSINSYQTLLKQFFLFYYPVHLIWRGVLKISCAFFHSHLLYSCYNKATKFYWSNLFLFLSGASELKWCCDNLYPYYHSYYSALLPTHLVWQEYLILSKKK